MESLRAQLSTTGLTAQGGRRRMDTKLLAEAVLDVATLKEALGKNF
jgi:hypothetical protein